MKNFFILVNTKYISSRELKTSDFSRVLCTHENSDVFNTLDEIYLVFTSKSKYPLYTYCPIQAINTLTERCSWKYAQMNSIYCYGKTP